MYTLLFRNRLAALGFVLLTIISAISLVGTKDREGVLAKTTHEIEAQKAEFEAKVEELQGTPTPSSRPSLPSETAPTQGDIAFMSDEDLIDSAEGFDPTPNDEFKPEAIAEQEEVVIILENEPETE